MSNSNSTRKGASDTDLLILVPLVCIVSIVAFVATTIIN